MDLFAFANHRGKSNKLYTTRMHLQSAIGTACAFLGNSSIKTTSVLPSHLILKSYHLYRFCFCRGNWKVLLYSGSSLNISCTERSLLGCYQPRLGLLLNFTWRAGSQEVPLFKMAFGQPDFQMTSKLNERGNTDFKNLELMSRLLRAFISEVRHLHMCLAAELLRGWEA